MAGKWYMAKAAGKKLANAFGKAVQHPEATPEGHKLVYESKTIKNMPGDYAPTELDTPAQRAFKGGRYQGDENYELSRDAIDARYSGEDRDVRKAVAGQEVDAMEAANSDYRLQEDFNKAFEQSYNKAKGTFDEAMDKLGGYSPEEKQQAYDRLRQIMIDKLKAGEPIEDVLDWGYNKRIYIK